MGFEVYEKGSAPVATVPTVTIQKRGLMSMNRAAYALIGSPEGLELLWDADRNVIGLRPAELTNPNAYPARAQNSSSDKGPILVAAGMFTKYIKIDTSEARRWVPKVEDGILCIDLNEPAQRATGNRSGSNAASNAED
jgi:hypothetical protein